MMDDALRRVKDAIYEPAAKQVGKHVHPHTITLTAGGVGLLCALAAWQGQYALGLGLWLLNRLLDGLDGAVARAAGKQSDFGGYLDTVVDFGLYAIIPIALTLHNPEQPAVVGLVYFLAACYVNAGAFLYLSAILERRNLGAKQRGELTTIHMPRGIIEGAEAVIFFSLFFIFPGSIALIFSMLATLIVATAVRHLWWAARHLR